MKRHLVAGFSWRQASLAACLLAATVSTANAQILFTENFDGLAGSLGPSVNERLGNSRVTRRPADFGTSVAIPNAFSHTAPGWTVNSTTYDAYGASVGNAGVALIGDPDYGVEEWEGWSFANKDFWVYVAGDQNRSQFTKASGNVAVADGDEWDDLHHVAPDDQIKGYMNTEMKTTNINVSAYRGQTLTFTFDSSWRPESFDDPHPSLVPPNQNNQGALVAANFDNAPAFNDTFLDNWDSNSAGGFYKPDSTNETITRSLFIPNTATNVQLKLGYYNASNDWWWAVDNLVLKAPDNSTVWSENFDAVPLGPSVNERNQPGGHVTVVETTPNTSPYPNAFTHTAPSGWSVDNSGGVPGIGNPTEGVEEWEGWSFTKPEFWLFVKDSRRSQFTKGTGLIAVADPDNWDALGDPEAIGTYNTLLVTPAIDISGVAAGNLRLAFDSSWRPEDTQRAILEVDYGNGWQEALRWESDSSSPNFHDNNTNESVVLALNNPAGATTARFRWGMVNATDDWWWAIDNISVSAVPEPATFGLISFGLFFLTIGRTSRRPE